MYENKLQSSSIPLPSKCKILRPVYLNLSPPSDCRRVPVLGRRQSNRRNLVLVSTLHVHTKLYCRELPAGGSTYSEFLLQIFTHTDFQKLALFCVINVILYAMHIYIFYHFIENIL